MTGARRTLLRGGVIAGTDRANATAMLVVEDRIAWVGDEAQGTVHRDDADRVIDLGGHLVTPGFVDAHVHATSTGLALSGLDLAGCRSLAEVLAAVEQRCREVRGNAVLGHGWDETAWPENRPPTAHELDRASYGSLVYLTRVDVHSAVVSSALMAFVPQLELQDGYDAAGWQRRAAHHAVRKVALDTVTASQRRVAQRLTRTTAAGLGIVAIHEMAGPDICGEEDLADLLALAAQEAGPEVVGYWGQTAASGGLDVVRRLGLRGAAGDLFVDGALGSRTACLHQPYADSAGEAGTLYLTAEEISDHVVACTRAGLQAGFHVIGDAAMATVVGGFRLASDAIGAHAVRAARHRLEHAEMVDPSECALLAELGVLASVQPAFDAAWGLGAGMYEARLGHSRAAELNPLSTLAAAGVALAFGSDSPVTPMDPWGALRAAVHHRTPGSGLSASAALTAHTSGGWKAAGTTNAGELTAGMLASFAVWSTHQMPSLEPGDTAPDSLLTVSRGAAIHDAGAL